MATIVIHLIILALIVLLCVCLAPLIFHRGWHGRQPHQKRKSLQPDTFVCMHCGTRKPVSQLSAEINRMCLECAEMYETVQDEL